MALHDAYARRTPYELALPGPDFARERFEAIREEAATRDVDLAAPETFLALPQAARTLDRIRPPGEEPGTYHRFASLLFHAFHFWRAGTPLYLLSTPAARLLVEAGVGREMEEPPGLPADAGYLQLPRHLFWVRPPGDVPAEPLDGFFWTAPGSGLLHLLVVAGIRPDRAGFSVVPLPEAPLDEAATWARASMRPGGRDFQTTLPGGELDVLYSMASAGEGYKLAALVFGYLDGHPERAREEAPPSPGPGGSPAASVLPYRRIVLDGEGASAAGTGTRKSEGDA